ncbi:hypothetical protein [Bradyrhizobium stylosanthis]|uniref:hypothetical protein n=1 Tax=Bradyrhizobium stylosanthis TaxID=1803665 RepID=UPI0012E8E644|nr:hypothetical protein [Bradyrhizobium stylosanthis]
MADQSAAIGFSSSLISGVERGVRSLPGGYLERLAEWLELTREDVTELRLLLTLGPITKANRVNSSEETLASILDRREVDRSNVETADENR